MTSAVIRPTARCQPARQCPTAASAHATASLDRSPTCRPCTADVSCINVVHTAADPEHHVEIVDHLGSLAIVHSRSLPRYAHSCCSLNYTIAGSTERLGGSNDLGRLNYAKGFHAQIWRSRAIAAPGAAQNVRLCLRSD
jgi:hypothetical protein